jgi:hypothetical protein
MNLLRDMLYADNLRDAGERPERFLETRDNHKPWPEELRPMTLEESALSILAQHKAYWICRTQMFRPVANCTKRIAKISRLAGYLRRVHQVRDGDTQDLVRFVVGTTLPGRFKVNCQRKNGAQVRVQWNVERCHCPGCSHL